MRQLMMLPPFSSQVLFKATSKNSEQAVQFLQELANFFAQKANNLGLRDLQIRQPFSAPLAKKAGYYRWLLLIQHPSRMALQKLLNMFDAEKEQIAVPSSIKLAMDIDPMDIG